MDDGGRAQTTRSLEVVDGGEASSAGACGGEALRSVVLQVIMCREKVVMLAGDGLFALFN